MEELIEPIIEAYSKQDQLALNDLLDEIRAKYNIEDRIELANFFNDQTFYAIAMQILNGLPEEPDTAKVAKAESFLGQDDNESALEKLSEINSDSPQYLESLIIKADLYQVEGQYNISENILLEAQTLTDNPIVRFALAEFYFSTEDYQKASLIYRALIDQGNEELGQVNLHKRLGNALFYVSEYADAIKELNSIDDLMMGEEDIVNLISAYTANDDLPSAKRVIDEFEDFNFVSPDYFLAASKVYKSMGETEQAIRVLQDGISVDDYDSNLKNELANMYIQNNDSKNALSVLDKILANDSENIDAVLSIGNIYLKDNQYADLIDFIESNNKEILEDDNRVAWILALGYLGDGQDIKASELIDKIYDNLNTNPDFVKDAISIYKNVDKVKTLRAIKDYLAINPDDPDIQDLLDNYEN